MGSSMTAEQSDEELARHLTDHPENMNEEWAERMKFRRKRIKHKHDDNIIDNNPFATRDEASDSDDYSSPWDFPWYRIQGLLDARDRQPLIDTALHLGAFGFQPKVCKTATRRRNPPFPNRGDFFFPPTLIKMNMVTRYQGLSLIHI